MCVSPLTLAAAAVAPAMRTRCSSSHRFALRAEKIPPISGRPFRDKFRRQLAMVFLQVAVLRAPPPGSNDFSPGAFTFPHTLIEFSHSSRQQTRTRWERLLLSACPPVFILRSNVFPATPFRSRPKAITLSETGAHTPEKSESTSERKHMRLCNGRVLWCYVGGGRERATVDISPLSHRAPLDGCLFTFRLVRVPGEQSREHF